MTACIVTKGNIDLAPILDGLVFKKRIVWDNSEREDAGVYGRYLAAEEADTDVVYFQDDDALVSRNAQLALLGQYEDGVYLANMDEWRNRKSHEELVLAGFGSLIRKDLPGEAFKRWGGDTESEAFRLVGCDVLVSVLTPHKRIDVGHEDLPYSAGDDRVHRRPEFAAWKDSFYNDALALREAPAPVKLNLGCGAYALEGFQNLDALTGWRYQDGLDHPDESVDAVTISHSLMYVPLDEWPAVFAELHRVLVPGGVVRVTEDNTTDRSSSRFGGHHDAVTLTHPDLVAMHLEQAGFTAHVAGPSETSYRDGSLIQNWHGTPPKVFFVEGLK